MTTYYSDIVHRVGLLRSALSPVFDVCLNATTRNIGPSPRPVSGPGFKLSETQAQVAVRF